MKIREAAGCAAVCWTLLAACDESTGPGARAFAFGVVPTSAIVNAGRSTSVYAYGWADSATLVPTVTVSALPAGVHADVALSDATRGRFSINLTADAGAALTTSSFTVSAKLGSTEHEVVVPLTVQAPPPTTHVAFHWCSGHAFDAWYQNEGEAWTAIAPDAAGAFSFDATPRVRFAIDHAEGNLGNVYSTTRVVAMTAEELQASDCQTHAGGVGYAAGAAPTSVVDSIGGVPFLLRFTLPRTTDFPDMAAVRTSSCSTSGISPHMTCTSLEQFESAGFAGPGTSWVLEPPVGPSLLSWGPAAGRQTLALSGSPSLFFGGTGQPGEVVQWAGVFSGDGVYFPY